MLYPRQTKQGELVCDDQMVGHREHLTQNHRVLFLSGMLSQETESHNLLMALDSLSHDPIKLVITSPGGDMDSALLFYDTMKLIQSPVETFGRYCASAAAMILAAGGRRYLSPHAKVMLHKPWGQAAGDSRDWEIQSREMKKYESKLVEALIECGAHRTFAEITDDIDRNLWLEPDEAIAYGLADEIMTKEKLAEWLSPIKPTGYLEFKERGKEVGLDEKPNVADNKREAHN